MNRICFPHVLHSGATFTASPPNVPARRRCVPGRPHDDMARTCFHRSAYLRILGDKLRIHACTCRLEASEITRTFCPSLNLGIVTVVQTMGTVMRNALLLVTAPRRLTTCAFCEELEDLLGWSVVLKQFRSNPLAEVLNLLCFLIRRRA